MRVGHLRPVGTTCRVRLYDSPIEPPLLAYTFDSPVERERGYRVVGVEEVARPGRWNVILERVSWSELLDHVDDVAFSLAPRA